MHEYFISFAFNPGFSMDWQIDNAVVSIDSLLDSKETLEFVENFITEDLKATKDIAHVTVKIITFKKL